jgi:hypothetical protein
MFLMLLVRRSSGPVRVEVDIAIGCGNGPFSGLWGGGTVM